MKLNKKSRFKLSKMMTIKLTDERIYCSVIIIGLITLAFLMYNFNCINQAECVLCLIPTSIAGLIMIETDSPSTLVVSFIIGEIFGFLSLYLLFK